jgi:hypothetical protein
MCKLIVLTVALLHKLYVDFTSVILILCVTDSSMTPDVEDLVLQLFELVNEKNELFRRQAELMYL